MTIRKLIVSCMLISVLFLLAGCGSGFDGAADNKAAVRQAFAVMNAQNFEGLREYIGEKYVRHCQATPDVVIEDFDTFIVLIKEWYAAFPDAVQTLHRLTADDDLVAFHATFEGTHQGPMNGVPATGKRISSETFGFHRLENGKIVETWVTWDNVAVLSQLGVFPAPAPESP